jgi:hypothetical protein
MNNHMTYHILADSVLILHLAFAVFALVGALAVLKWRGLIWLHVPAALWAGMVMIGGWLCPLTPLEHWLRVKAGMAVEKLGFIEQYVTPLLYPTPLTRRHQMVLGTLVLAVNGLIYGWMAWRFIRTRRRPGSAGDGRG